MCSILANLRPQQGHGRFSLYLLVNTLNAQICGFQTTALNSTIPLPYLDEGLLRRWQTEPAVPTSEKLDALVFVRAACTVF